MTEEVRHSYPTAKLYRCPVCGDVLTEEEWEADFEIGGNGMCPCDFKDGERVYHEYDVYHYRHPHDETHKNIPDDFVKVEALNPHTGDDNTPKHDDYDLFYRKKYHSSPTTTRKENGS